MSQLNYAPRFSVKLVSIILILSNKTCGRKCKWTDGIKGNRSSAKDEEAQQTDKRGVVRLLILEICMKDLLGLLIQSFRTKLC